MGWVINVTSRPLYLRERPGTHCIRVWVGLRAGLDVYGKSRPPPNGTRSPDRPASIESLYRLRYPGPIHIYIRVYNQGVYLVYMRRSKCHYSLRMDTGVRFSLPYISRFHPNILLYWSNDRQVTCFICQVCGCLLILTVCSPTYRILTRKSRSVFLLVYICLSGKT